MFTRRYTLHRRAAHVGGLLAAAQAVACTDTDKSPKEPDPVTASLAAPADPSPEADLRRLRPNGRLGYTVIPRPQPDPEISTRPLEIGERHHNRGLACRRPDFAPTRVMRSDPDGRPVELDTWWFEFTPEGFHNANAPAGQLLARPDPEAKQLVSRYRVGYVIFEWQGELRYHAWFTEVGDVGPVAFATMLGDVRTRLGCEKVDLQWIAAPPRPYRSYATFGVEVPDAELRRLPPLNTGTNGVLCRRPDFPPTRHDAHGATGGVDAWFFEYDPSIYPGFGHGFAPLDGRTDYRAGYVVFDWHGELRMHDWSTVRGTHGGGPMMHGTRLLDKNNRFGCIHSWHN